MLTHLKEICSSRSHISLIISTSLHIVFLLTSSFIITIMAIILHHGDHHHHHHLHGDHRPHADNPQRLPDRDQQLHVVLLQARMHRRGVQVLASPGFKHFLTTMIIFLPWFWRSQTPGLKFELIWQVEVHVRVQTQNTKHNLAARFELAWHRS